MAELARKTLLPKEDETRRREVGKRVGRHWRRVCRHWKRVCRHWWRVSCGHVDVEDAGAGDIAGRKDFGGTVDDCHQTWEWRVEGAQGTHPPIYKIFLDYFKGIFSCTFRIYSGLNQSAKYIIDSKFLWHSCNDKIIEHRLHTQISYSKKNLLISMRYRMQPNKNNNNSHLQCRTPLHDDREQCDLS